VKNLVRANYKVAAQSERRFRIQRTGSQPFRGRWKMLYAILAYHVEGEITRLTPEEDAALMEHLIKINARLEREGKLGPAARLDLTQSAVTLRGNPGSQIIDGPFAETKEQLLGFYAVNCSSLDEAVAIAQEFKEVNTSAVYEIRPIVYYAPGVAMTAEKNAAE